MQSIGHLRWSLARSSQRKCSVASSRTNGLRTPSIADLRTGYPVTASYTGLTRSYITSYVDKRPTKGKFHVTEDLVQEVEEDLSIDEETSYDPALSAEGEDYKPLTIRPSRNGPEYVLVGQDEAGTQIFRRKGADYTNMQIKHVEQLWPANKKRSMKTYKKVLIEQPLKDADMDNLVEPSEMHDAPFDFSRLSSFSQDLNQLAATIQSKTRLNVPVRRNQLIQAFESVARNQDVKPMDPSLFATGKELVELHVLNALTSTYPNLPSDALIRFTEQSTNPSSLARALLLLGLEPFIAIVPNIPLSKFADPSQTCLQLASNTYLSLVGLLYQDLGFEEASSFVFESLKLVSVTPSELKRLKLLDGVKDSKHSLNALLYKLRSPLPVYEMESSTGGKPGSGNPLGGIMYTAIVKSGPKIIGRGQASSKTRAEARAAANALLHHWSIQSSL